MRNQWEIFFLGSAGISTSISGFAISFMGQVEIFLRIVSLIIGIAVGILTIISLLRNFKDKK